MKHSFKNIQGFTLVELVVSIGIFALMTTLLLAKYGTFNQGIILTNLAYDVALTVRNAQSYGLNVKSAPTAGENFSSDFNYSYGVHFSSNSNTFTFFKDADNYLYDNPTLEKISDSVMKRNSKISALCVGTVTACSSVSTLDVVFKRPNPDAIINGVSSNSYAEITLQGSDGSIRKVVVRSTGQIAVQN